MCQNTFNVSFYETAGMCCGEGSGDGVVHLETHDTNLCASNLKNNVQ